MGNDRNVVPERMFGKDPQIEVVKAVTSGTFFKQSRVPSTDMSDTKKPNTTTTDTARMEALSWLAGQYRWESLLADLHDLAAREDEGDDPSKAA